MEISKRKRTARGVAIASLVIAIIMIASCVLAATFSAIAANNILADPTLVDDSQDYYIKVGTLFSGTDVTVAQGLYACLILLSIFLGFGAILNLIPLMASVRAIRAAKRENNTRSSYVLAAIGAAVAFLTFNPVNGVLLIIVAINLQADYVDVVGEEVAYKGGKRLGPMRFLEFLCVLDLVATIAVVIFVTKSDYGTVYDMYYWLDFIKLLMEAVVLWLIWNRKQHGREIIMGMVVVYLVLHIALSAYLADDYAIGSLVTSSLVPILLLIYFGFSRRPRDLFTEPFKTQNREKQLAEDEKLWNPKSWRFWRNLLLYFCIFSVIGHWMEWCVCWIIRIAVEHGITALGTYDPNSGIWSNMLNPFFVYGAALVLIGLVLYPMRNLFYRKISNRVAAFIASFVFNMALIALLELVIGLTQNTPPDPVTGKLPLWDYSTMPLNFMGQICLLNTTFFTIMATIFTNLVYPNLEKVFAKLPDDVMNVLTVVVIVFFVLVVSMYVAPGMQDISSNIALELGEPN